MSLLEAIGQAAPIYNLGFVVIVLILFYHLFKTGWKNENIFLKPWALIFGGLCIYIVEEVFTILRSAGVIRIPVHINGFFELMIIILFIHAVLLQKEHIRTMHRSPVAKVERKRTKKKRKKRK